MTSVKLHLRQDFLQESATLTSWSGHGRTQNLSGNQYDGESMEKHNHKRHLARGGPRRFAE